MLAKFDANDLDKDFKHNLPKLWRYFKDIWVIAGVDLAHRRKPE